MLFDTSVGIEMTGGLEGGAWFTLAGAKRVGVDGTKNADGLDASRFARSLLRWLGTCVALLGAGVASPIEMVVFGRLAAGVLRPAGFARLAVCVAVCFFSTTFILASSRNRCHDALSGRNVSMFR